MLGPSVHVLGGQGGTQHVDMKEPGYVVFLKLGWHLVALQGPTLRLECDLHSSELFPGLQGIVGTIVSPLEAAGNRRFSAQLTRTVR